MIHARCLTTFSLGVVLLLGAPITECRAGLNFEVSLDTSLLIGHPAGPFEIDFQLNPGAGTGTNSVTISNFTFGTGSPLGSPTYTGSASGSLSSSVMLSEGSFLNEFTQSFTAGKTLTFDVNMTTNVVRPTPDQFSFAILDCMGNELPTTSPLDAIVVVNIDSSSPTILTYGGDPSRAPSCGGPPIPFLAPSIVPEPPSLALMALGSLSLLILPRQRTRVWRGLA